MNFERYTDIPYDHLGRSFKGADCWGIIWLIYKEEKGIILPDKLTYKEFWYKEENKNHLLDEAQEYSNKVQVHSPFNPLDVLFFYNKSRSFVDHVGIVTDMGKFLHTYRESLSKIDRLQGYWESRVWKGYRWQK